VLERITMRFSILLTLAAGLALASDNVKPVTYLEGNLEGFVANVGGKLEFRDSKAMVLHAKSWDAVIPYAAVSKTSEELIPVVSEKDPLYKVWSLHKRLLIPTPLHAVTVVYKDKSGVEKTVKLEMEKSAATRVQAQVKQAADQKAANDGAWWGDSVWKTARNKQDWGGAGVLAQRE
jgi:hypothetical protein